MDNSPKKNKKPGRKEKEITSDQWDELFLTIAENALSTQTICKNLGLTFSVIWKRIGRSKILERKYARAKEEQCEVLAEEILSIADDTSKDLEIAFNKANKPYIKLNREHFESRRLRIDSRKWIVSKLKPKKYGDKITNKLETDKGGLKINFAVPKKAPKTTISGSTENGRSDEKQ